MLHISVGWSSGVINSNSRTFVFPHFSLCFCLVFLCSCYSTSCSLTRGSGRWEKPSSRSAEVRSEISSEAGTKLRPVPVNPPPAHGSYGSDMFFHPTFLQTLQTWPRPLKLSQTEGLNPAFQSRLQQKQRLTEGGWKNILSLCWVSFLFFFVSDADTASVKLSKCEGKVSVPFSRTLTINLNQTETKEIGTITGKMCVVFCKYYMKWKIFMYLKYKFTKL